jgi:hypothetical protein
MQEQITIMGYVWQLEAKVRQLKVEQGRHFRDGFWVGFTAAGMLASLVWMATR